MELDRREFISAAGLGLAAAGMFGSAAFAADAPKTVKVGICDWNLGGACNPDLIPRAKEAHLDGIQVSVGTNPDNIPLRHAEVRNKYIELGKQYGIEFHSVAAGGILNEIPLASEPQSAVYVIDAVEAAAALGAQNILIAFFGNGDLRLRDARGRFRNISDGPFKEYELDARGVTRVVEVLKQIVPRAEYLGVALGLENTLTAKQNLEIIERIGSSLVQVYYDVGNSTSNGYDVPTEIRLLGKDRICEIHLKDNGKDVQVLTSPNVEVKWEESAQACKEIGYDKWYVLEESGREKRFIEDTQANVAFAKKLFS
ncbi:MAG TPA: sugar phosphate isomerase/epimerase [bacterium]|nr:sugar phosphate isomerase/epimerase [bacterium]HOL96601.1 sugar phosphate isomerase/epimerase [bacterium]HXK96008.1 sugar phosphate isomerase/epimerase [bacterium]